MSDDPHWENLKEIFHAAAALPMHQRANYLDRVCDGDLSLRQAVESLLKSHEETGNFVDAPAYQAAADMLVDGIEFKAGQTLAHYKILSLLGEGGMGRVYLAEDTKLHRKVSLKFLSINVTQDHERLRRFEQEARAASALNHPNIITIYEIGEEDGHQFIATEFIEGQTLRERLRSPLDLNEALEIATQAASALVAAHRVNIVHRDIKPENIMIRKEDGLVKVLDFGLAKITVPRRAMIDPEADTQLRNTAPGVVMGTVAYMSPEQARGDTVDERTDIWSLGVVLYEMVAGCSPFVAGTSNEIVSAILSKQTAPPLARYANSVPERLEEIVEKSLTKNKDERYQTSKDLLIDLKRLQQTLQLKAISERSASPDKFGVSPLSESDKLKFVEQSSTSLTQPASNAEYLVNQVKNHKRKVVVAATVLLLIFVSVFFYVWRLRQTDANAQSPISSIAVLPFVNASGDPESEYLSDGITDSLINSLSQLPNMKVMSRNSVFRFKGKETDAQAAGQALGVSAVLTGRLLQRGDNLSISVELVDAHDNSHLWGGQYDRKLSDVLSMQAQMAREISERLRLRLAGEDKKRLAKHYTENNEAYQLYLRGRFYWNKRTREAYKKAIEFFNQAIEQDPNYALAYSGLADCYTQGDYPLLPKERLPLAKQSALKAIELDNTLAEPHISLGRIKQIYDWDGEGAEKELKLAIELNPNSSLAHMRYAEFFTLHSRHEEAISEGKKAVALDAVSPLMYWMLGFQFYWARRYDEAMDQDHKTLELDPNFIRSYYQIGMSYEQKGMYEQAFEWYSKGANLDGRTSEIMALKEAYDAAGIKGYQRKKLNLQMANAEQDLSRQSLYNVAVLYAQLGEKEKSLEWLQKAFEERPYGVMFLKIDPAFDKMRSDPRFQDLMKRVGLAMK
jgi:eukaryotic-like serine/threonine-protein kinase